MKHYLQTITSITMGLFIVTSVMMSPALASAKESGNGHEHGKNNTHEIERNEHNNQSPLAIGSATQEQDDHDSDYQTNSSSTNSANGLTGCLQAFGHFIAPGWIKRNGQLSISDACWSELPFGIGRHFEHSTSTNSTSTPPGDTTPPTISTITTSVGSTSISIHWNTDESATTKVYYSTTTPLVTTASTTQYVSGTTFNTSHDITITGLTASTTYYFIVSSTDPSGNIATSSEFSATTATTSVADITPPVISNALAIIGTSTAKLSWNTDEPATSKVYFSTSSPLIENASSTMFVTNSSLVTSHELTVTGLSTSTLYYMVIESADASQNIARTGQFSFTTNTNI